MADIFEDRRKGMEDEYFHRQDKAALEKLRAKIAVAEQAKAAGTSSMKCPRCDGMLKESTFEGVTIDTCEKCAGVWLDSGELQQLTAQEGGWINRFWKR